MHIGKSSAGWCFSLHVAHPRPDECHCWGDDGRPESFEQWKDLIEDPSNAIFDEYGDRVSAEDMLRCITERSHPRGLLRHDLDAHYCVGHGRGTWDLMIGEFS